MLLKLLPDMLDRLNIFILEIEELEIPQVGTYTSLFRLFYHSIIQFDHRPVKHLNMLKRSMI